MRLFQEHLEGKVDHNFRIWMLINMEVWYRLFILGTPKNQVREWISKTLDDSHAN